MKVVSHDVTDQLNHVRGNSLIVLLKVLALSLDFWEKNGDAPGPLGDLVKLLFTERLTPSRKASL